MAQWHLLARYSQTLREGLEVSLQLAADAGGLYAPAYGLLLGLRQSWGLLQEDVSEVHRFRLRSGYR